VVCKVPFQYLSPHSQRYPLLMIVNLLRVHLEYQALDCQLGAVCSKCHYKMFRELCAPWLASRVHYISIKHTAYVTYMLYGVIMHAALVTSLSMRKFLKHFLKKIVNLLLVHCWVISTWEFRRCSQVRETLGCVLCFPNALLSCC